MVSWVTRLDVYNRGTDLSSRRHTPACTPGRATREEHRFQCIIPMMESAVRFHARLRRLESRSRPKSDVVVGVGGPMAWARRDR